jgi:hypothetical protein
MADHTVKLVLGEVEVEVLEEALDLYLRARPAAADQRFEYRYRVAHGILGTLTRLPTAPAAVDYGDDEFAGRAAGRRVERLED